MTAERSPGREPPKTEAGSDFLAKLPRFSAETVADGRMAWMHVLAIEAEAIAAERERIWTELLATDEYAVKWIVEPTKTIEAIVMY